MNILERIDNYLTESKEKVGSIIFYSSPNDSEELYFLTDGKNYSLDKGDGLFLTDKKGIKHLTVDGPLKSKSDELDVMEYKGKFGLWDNNLKLVEPYKDMDQLEQHYKDDMADYGEFEYAKRLRNFDFE